MALSLQNRLFLSPALPEPFVAFDLENELAKENVLPNNKGTERRDLQERW